MSETGGRYQNIRVFYDRVLVQREEAKREYAPGIAVPDSFQRKTQEGVVLAVDPGGRYIAGRPEPVPVRVQVGDHVAYGKHAGTEVELLDGTTAFVLREDEIVCAADPVLAAAPVAYMDSARAAEAVVRSALP